MMADRKPPSDICAKPYTKGKHKGKPRTGYPAGNNAHRKAGERPCEACRVGLNVHMTPNPKKTFKCPEMPPGMACKAPTVKYPNGQTGTNNGRRMHRNAEEEYCEGCKPKPKQTPTKLPMMPFGRACEARSPAYPNGAKGTAEGHRRHWKENEPSCDECREANRAKHEQMQRDKGVLPPLTRRDFDGPVCAQPTAYNPEGATRSWAGVARHRDRGESVCDECRDWANAEMRRRRAEGDDSHKEHRRMRKQKHWDHLTKRDGAGCYICGTHVEMETGELDHVVPRKLGGASRLRNYKQTCRPCNRQKSGNLLITTLVRRRQDGEPVIPGAWDLALSMLIA